MIILGDIIEQIRGLSYSKKDVVSKSIEGYNPVLRAGNIQLGQIIEDNYVYVPNNLIKEKQFLKEGDMLIAASSGSLSIVGKAAMVHSNMDATFGAFCKVLRPKQERVYKGYFKHYFETSYYKRTIKSLAEGANINNLRTGHFDNLEIPLPPLDQQKKIAAILDAADAYRQKTKALIEKYDELLNSIVYQCLGDSLNKDLKNIKSGSKEFLEDGYSWYSLDEITELIADIDHKMPKSVEKGKIFLSAKDLSDNGELDFSNPKFISEEDFKHLSRKVKPKKLDIIYSRIGAKLGKARLVKTDHDFIVSYSCCTIRPKQDIVAPLYLKYILDSEATLRQASHGTRGIGVPDLGMGEIRTFKIPVPEKSISKKIVNQLERIEAQKAQTQASLAQAEDLFSSLLQRAYKGELTS